MEEIEPWEVLATQYPSLDAKAARAAFEQIRQLSSDDPSVTPLPAAEAELLDNAGFRPATDAQRAAVQSRTGAEVVALLQDAVRPDALADVLGKTPGRIRQMVSDRQLVAIKIGRTNHLPRFQFTTTPAGELALIPNAEHVFVALPEGLAPVAIAQWFQRANAELVPEDLAETSTASDAALSPKAWLLAGFPVEPVIDAAADLAGMPAAFTTSLSADIATALAVLRRIDRTPGTRAAHPTLTQAMTALKGLQENA